MKKLNAFTLAEVLITLAVIGVVAAMTIPTLITHNQQKGWDTSATVFERKLGEALSIMNTQQVLAGYNSTEAFVAELQKHLKIIKTCDNNNLAGCFEDTVYWTNGDEVDLSKVKTTKNFAFSNNDFMGDNETNVMGIQLASGVSALIAHNPQCVSNPYSNQAVAVTGGVTKNTGSVRVGTNCVAVLYDTTGNKKPNTLSKDLRSINIAGINKIVEPICISGAGCFKPAQIINTSINCSNQASAGDDWEYCVGKKNGNQSYSSDYWAMANKTCGGQSKVASVTQLAQIADYIHGTSGTAWNGEIGPMQGQEGWSEETGTRAAELGLPASGDFAIWSGNEHNEDYASRMVYSWHFGAGGNGGSSFYNAAYRNFSGFWVLCTDD